MFNQCLPGDWVQNILSESSDIYGECAKCRPLWSVLGVNRLLTRNSQSRGQFGQDLEQRGEFWKMIFGWCPLSLSLGKGESSEWSRALLKSSVNLVKCFLKDRLLKRRQRRKKGSMCLASVGNRACLCPDSHFCWDYCRDSPAVMTQCSFGTDRNISSSVQHQAPWNPPLGSQALGSTSMASSALLTLTDSRSFIFDCTVQHMASLVPDQGLNHIPALEVQSLKHWTTRGSPHIIPQL